MRRCRAESRVALEVSNFLIGRPVCFGESRVGRGSQNAGSSGHSRRKAARALQSAAPKQCRNAALFREFKTRQSRGLFCLPFGSPFFNQHTHPTWISAFRPNQSQPPHLAINQNRPPFAFLSSPLSTRIASIKRKHNNPKFHHRFSNSQALFHQTKTSQHLHYIFKMTGR